MEKMFYFKFYKYTESLRDIEPIILIEAPSKEIAHAIVKQIYDHRLIYGGAAIYKSLASATDVQRELDHRTTDEYLELPHVTYHPFSEWGDWVTED